MKILLHIIILTILICFRLSAQTLTSSNLPVIIISTDNDPKTGKPLEIPDEPKVPGHMKIVFHPDGSRNFVSDQNNPFFLNYDGRIAIELRGSTSQNLPKKPYGFTTLKPDNITNNNVSLLGMPAENDWVLSNLAYEPGLIRDYLSYTLAAEMGNYAPRCVFVEVIVNGDYKGLYLLVEKIKVDANRVNIVKMNDSDNISPNVSGGYIVKADKTTGGDPVAWTMESYFMNVNYVYDTPDPTYISPQQADYIKNVFFNLQTAMTNHNASLINGYPSIIDIPSFIDFMLINELSSNADGYQFSTFFHKDRNGKLRAGPVWDFNLTYGNDLFQYGVDRSKTNVWQFDNKSNNGSKFWKDLYDDPLFKCYLSKRWNELIATGMPLNKNVMYNKIDQVHTLITEAASREEAKWKTVGNLDNNISSIKTWLLARMMWMNTYLDNYQACVTVAVPALVISKINYHPEKNGGYAGTELEFIELVNNSSQEIDLTGIYFSNLGINYSFPAGAKLPAHNKIYLASNDTAFQKHYGIIPFGRFSRNLSNKSEKLLLSDAYGNVIDMVEYADSMPWPEEADGNGAYLKLKDYNLDNSLASSWEASYEQLTDVNMLKYDKLLVYPNPVKNSMAISSENKLMKHIDITNSLGQVILSTDVEINFIVIDLEHFIPGVYIINVVFDNGDFEIRKVIKN